MDGWTAGDNCGGSTFVVVGRRKHARCLDERIAVLEETIDWVVGWIVFLVFEVVQFFIPIRLDRGRLRPPNERPRWVASLHDRWYASATYLIGGLLFVAVVLVGGYLVYVIVVALVVMWATGIDGVATPVLVSTVLGAVVAGLFVTAIVAKVRPGRDSTIPFLLTPVLVEILVFGSLRLEQ